MKYVKVLSILLSLIISFQLFFYVQPTHAKDEIVVRLYAADPQMFDVFADKGIRLIEAYPTFFLVEVNPSHIEWIKEESLYFQEEKDYHSLFFQSHLFTSEKGGSIQAPSYLKKFPQLAALSDLYMLQFIGPEKEEWINALKAYGVEMLSPLYQNGWLCKIDPLIFSSVRSLRFIKACDQIPFSSKIHKALFPLVNTDGKGDIYIQAMEDFDLPSFLNQKGIPQNQVSSYNRDQLLHVIIEAFPFVHFADLALNLQILKVDPHSRPVPSNYHASRVIASQKSNGLGINEDTIPGLDGSGEIIGVADTGIVDTHPDFWDLDTSNFSDKVIATFPPGGWQDHDPDIEGGGHGTHVAGTVLGTGREGGLSRYNKGIAYNARLVSQKFLNSSYYTSYSHMLQEAYDNGARTHNNSWGQRWVIEFPDNSGIFWDYRGYQRDGAGDYTSFDRDIDRFLWNRQDFTMVKSAGNERGDPFELDNWLGSPPPYFGYTYPFSNGSRTIATTSTAKNLICVGATENEDGVTQGSFAPDRSAEQHRLAPFSSIGPTRDGRIKPDVVAPGDALESADRTYPANTYIPYSGTSMAAPVVTGAAALARQWYREREDILPHHISSSLIKATLINGCVRNLWDSDKKHYGATYTNAPITNDPNPFTGFGRINLLNSLQPANKNMLYINAYDPDTNSLGLSNNHRMDTYYIRTKESPQTFQATLVWTDYADSDYPANGDQRALVNDLHLEILDMNTMIYYRGNQSSSGFSRPSPLSYDHANNVEQVTLAGTDDSVFMIQVKIMDNIRSDSANGNRQPYALVLSGGYIERMDESEVPDPVKPVHKMNLEATIECDGIRLDWSDPMYTKYHGSVAYYVLTRRALTGPNAGEVRTWTWENNQKQYYDNQAEWNQEYYYIITAYNSADTLVAHSWNVVTGHIIPPSRPYLYLSTMGSTFQLYWHKPIEGACPIQSYRIYRSSDGLTLGNLVASLSEARTYFIDSTAQPGDEWYYTLVAVDSRNNESAPSSPVKIVYPVDGSSLRIFAELNKPTFSKDETAMVMVTVFNQGNATATNTRVKMTLPQELSFLRASRYRSVVQTPAIIEFELGAIAPNSVQTFQVDVKINVAVSQIRSIPIHFDVTCTEKSSDFAHVLLQLVPQRSGRPDLYLGLYYRNASWDPLTSSVYIQQDTPLEIDFVLTGAQAPYELSIDWGDGTTEVLSQQKDLRQTLRHQFKNKGKKTITVKVTDQLQRSKTATISMEVR